MSSMFNTSATLQHITPLPPGVSPEKCVCLLHGHEFVIQYDPHMITYTQVAVSEPEPLIPAERELTAIAPPKAYSVTDRVHALPAGLWDSDVVSTYEFIDVESGVFVRIRSPMNVVMETVWSVRPVAGSIGLGGEGAEFELVEDIVIKCSRFLMGTVKGTCESGWQGIHEKMMDHLQDPNRAK